MYVEITMCVYICVCVCVFIYFNCKRIFLTEQNNNCDARVQVNDGMLRKYFCMKKAGTLKLATVQKSVQLNGAKPQAVKTNSYKLSKIQR